MTGHYRGGHPLSPNPKGWFAVDLSDSLQPGAVKPLSIVGRDLVLFRTAAGEPGVLSAYCSHLGTHLGYGGHVDDGLLRCPFHHWGFEPNGRCGNIPIQRRYRREPTCRACPWSNGMAGSSPGLIRTTAHRNGRFPNFHRLTGRKRAG